MGQVINNGEKTAPALMSFTKTISGCFSHYNLFYYHILVYVTSVLYRNPPSKIICNSSTSLTTPMRRFHITQPFGTPCFRIFILFFRTHPLRRVQNKSWVYVVLRWVTKWYGAVLWIFIGLHCTENYFWGRVHGCFLSNRRYIYKFSE